MVSPSSCHLRTVVVTDPVLRTDGRGRDRLGRGLCDDICRGCYPIVTALLPVPVAAGCKRFYPVTVPSTSRPGWARRATRNGGGPWPSTQSAARLRVLTGIVAVSLSAAACGGGSSDSGSGVPPPRTPDYSKWCDMKSELQGKTVSIYTSIVTLRIAPHKASQEFEDCTGVTIKYEGDKDFGRTSAARPVRQPARRRLRPAAGSAQTMVMTTGKAIPASKTVSDEVDKYFGADWRKVRLGRRQTLRGTARREREVLRVVLPEEVHGEGLQGPDDLGRAHGSHRQDRHRRPGGQAPGVPASARARPPAGRAPTGSRMCSCVPRAGHLRPVGRPQDPLQRPKVVEALGKVAAILGTRSTSAAASVTCPPSRRPPSGTAASRSSRASATCTARPRSAPPSWPEGWVAGDVWAFYLPAVDSSSKPFLGGWRFVQPSVMTSRGQGRFAAFLASPLGQRQGEGHDGRRLVSASRARPGGRGLPDRPAGPARSSRIRRRSSRR